MLRERPRMDYADYEMKLKAKRKNALGEEIPDPVPMAAPPGFQNLPSLIDTVNEMIRNYNAQQKIAAEGGEFETFDEANDFDIDEDPESRSGYEVPDEDDHLLEADIQSTLEPSTDDIDRGSLPPGEGKGQGEKEAGSPAEENEKDTEAEGHATPASDRGGAGVARPSSPSPSTKKRK